MNFYKFNTSIVLFLSTIVFICCSKGTITEVDTEDQPELITYNWNARSWEGISDNTPYLMQAGEIHKPITVTEGIGTNYTTASTSYFNTRIPTAEVANDGSLVLVWQGRHDGTDRGFDHLLVSRSTDFGQTWAEQALFTEKGVDLGANAIVIDRKTGRLFAMAWSVTHQNQLIFYSDDHGVNWKEQPHAVITNPEGEPLRMRGTTGIQVFKGEKNHLVMPTVTGSGTLTYMVCDAGAKNWRYATHKEEATGEWNEPTLVEVKTKDEHQSALLNVTRRMDANDKTTFKRKATFQFNPETFTGVWTPAGSTADFAFHTTKCNQHLKRYSGICDGQESYLLYSSTIRGVGYSPSRYGGTVAISADEGDTWTSKTIVPADVHFGYSCQVVLPDGSIGLFYETTNNRGKEVRYGSIKFIRYTLDWLSRTS